MRLAFEINLRSRLCFSLYFLTRSIVCLFWCGLPEVYYCNSTPASSCMSYMEACAEVPWEHYHLTLPPLPGFEPGSLDCESNTLNTDIQRLAYLIYEWSHWVIKAGESLETELDHSKPVDGPKRLRLNWASGSIFYFRLWFIMIKNLCCCIKNHQVAYYINICIVSPCVLGSCKYPENS